MTYLDRIAVPLVFLIFVIFSCKDPPSTPETNTQVSETRNLVFVPIDQKQDSTDVSQLNQWIERYPDKRIVSFSSVIDANKSVLGYVILFVPGSSSNQQFIRIERYDLGADKEDPVQHGMMYVQTWVYEHSDLRVVGLTTIPNSLGKVEAYMICFESTPKE